jgi:hypothetical protein
MSVGFVLPSKSAAVMRHRALKNRLVGQLFGIREQKKYNASGYRPLELRKVKKPSWDNITGFGKSKI